MQKNLKTILTEVDDFFREKPNSNQKAWGVVNQFYHLVITYMEENNIKHTQLAEKLGKSRSYISQLFSKTPNISIKKMVEIADAIGLTLEIDFKELRKKPHQVTSTQEEYVIISIDQDEYRNYPIGRAKRFKNTKLEIPLEGVFITSRNEPGKSINYN